ncbi:hypothetical protein CUMW_244420, partial [Citrus unshiu]
KILIFLQEVDVVISTVAYPQFLDQLKIVDAIKVAGNIKRFLPSEFGCEEDRVMPLPPFEAYLEKKRIRFLPSEFGCEEDRVMPLPPFEAYLEKKRIVRRAIEAAEIPYTFVSANCYGAYFVNVLLRPSEPHDDVVVYGNVVFNYEEDIANCTIKVINDPRTCNRIVIYRPQTNIISQLELISVWEQKTGRSFKRVHVSEEELVNLSQSKNFYFF